MKAGYQQNHSEHLSKGIGVEKGGHEAVQSMYLKLGGVTCSGQSCIIKQTGKVLS